MSFGENLKRARTSIGMTQAELARRTGITEARSTNYEMNSRAPKIDVVGTLCTGTGGAAGKPDGGDGALAASSPQAKMERALRQAQDVFESELPARSKELFFEQIALAYFRFQEQQGQKGQD